MYSYSFLDSWIQKINLIKQRQKRTVTHEHLDISESNARQLSIHIKSITTIFNEHTILRHLHSAQRKELNKENIKSMVKLFLSSEVRDLVIISPFHVNMAVSWQKPQHNGLRRPIVKTIGIRIYLSVHVCTWIKVLIKRLKEWSGVERLELGAKKLLRKFLRFSA